MPRWLFRRKFIVALWCCIPFLLAFLFFAPMGRRDSKHRKNWEMSRRNNPERAREKINFIQKKDQRYVIYNRVPKCGSMSMTTLYYRLGGANDFKVASPYEDGEKPSKSEEEQSTFVDFIEKQPRGYVYIRHQYFVDFTKFGRKQPIYINMIRDPVARFQSFYYFSRFGNERGGGASARMSDERREETIDQCIQKRRQECIKPYWQVVPYFCGQEPGCMSRSQWAVDRAIDNIKHHYVFVGVLERLDDSLEIMEKLLPVYFKNARKIYQNPENERMKHETHTRNKQILSEAAKEFLKTETSLKLEYKLYDYVQQQLSELKDIL